MQNGIFFSIISLCYMIMLCIIFFSKKRIKTEETRIYGKLIITNLIGLIIEVIPCTYAVRCLYNVNYDLTCLILKSILIYFIIWVSLFTYYIFTISIKKKDAVKEQKIKEILKKVLYTLNIITAVLILILKLDVYYQDGASYSFGPAANIVYVISGMFIVVWIILLLRNKGNYRNKKYIPIYSFMVVGLVAMVIQYIYPELTLMLSVEALVLSIMYHTIENPDIKMLREVENARDLAEKANRAKSDFLSSMSHEIRTPLNAIVGLSEDNLNYQDKCPKEVIENCNDVISASQTLLEIVGNILDINKIESEKMEVKETEYNFKEEIEKLARIDATRIGEKPIDFKIKIAEDIPEYLYGDKNHMKQIVNNLLSNAIKYTNEGTILFTVKCINKDNICHLFISVQDTGIGIKAENIKKLFTKFERLDVERNTTTEGTGLGLAITKKLVNMMGGKINVESQFGKGSIFMVTIPQKIVYKEPTYETITYHSANTIENKNIEKTIQENTAIVEQTNTKVDIENKKRILVVDDNNLNIKVAKRALEGINIIVDSAMSGSECIEKINNGEKYDVILMDIMMPEMSGETTLKKLKENPNFNTPVIAVTADAMANAEEKYINEGFIAYIAKPFTKDQIQEKLNQIKK